MESVRQLMERLKIGEEAIALRREIHMHPELSEHEYNTMALICSKLDELGIAYKKGVAETGIVGLIEGAYPGPTVGIRADMDALPINEETELDYKSQVPNVMHACGHDVHTSVLFGTAKALSEMKERLHGNVKLLFQPAEETIGGAERMINEGCLENPHVDCMLGLHVSPDLDAGQVGIKYGKMYAASDMFTLRVHGRSCHGARPADGVDAVLIAAEIICSAQSIVSRNVGATDSAVVTFGTINGGRVRNQIADFVEMKGIIRTLDPDTRLLVRKRLESICLQTAEMLGGSAEFILEPSYSPLINNDEMTELVRGTATDILGSENVILRKEPSLGVEDFAYFAAQRPACFFHLGCGISDPKTRFVHSCYFTADERCIPIGIEIQTENVLRILGK